MTDRKRQIESLQEDLRAIRQKIARYSLSLSSELKITFTQFIILDIISENDGISIKELAGLMGITSSGATQQVDSLVKKGYLVRRGRQEDRRSLKISLSENMKKQLNTLKTRHMENLSSIYEVLSDNELGIFCELNRKIASRILEK